MNRVLSEDILNTPSIIIPSGDDCNDEELSVREINAVFTEASNPNHDAYLRRIVYQMSAIQSEAASSSDAQTKYERLVHGLNFKTLCRIQTLDDGLCPQRFNPLRSAFLDALRQDQHNAASQKPEAARLREQGQGFTPQLIISR